MEDYSRLCCLIIQDIYGDFLAQIFEHLIQQGRLSAPQLAQKCRLLPRQVKSGLATLIQLRLVYHHVSLEGLSTYQANTHNAYNLMRSGRLIQLAGETEGSLAAEIMEHLALLGYATVRELEAQFVGLENNNMSHKASQQANGHRDIATPPPPAPRTTSVFRGTLKNLINNKYITRVRDAHFPTVFDARQDIERYINSQSHGPATKTKKMQMDLDARVTRELEQQLDSTVSADTVLNGLLVDDVHEPSTVGRILLCVDFTNLIFAVRNRALATMAEKPFGSLAASVLRAALRQVDLDSSPLTLRSQENLSEIPTQALSTRQIEEDVGSDHCVPFRDSSSQPGNGSTEDQIVNGYHEFNGNGVHDKSDILRELEIMAEGPFSFIDCHAGNWFVHKREMSQFLRNKELMRLIGQDIDIDDPSLRIVRMLIKRGKMDEKSLQEIGLLNAKELRKCLADLQKTGLLQLQEVPREPQRQPNRTIFLWFYDAERVQKLFLNKLYKSMARLFQRLYVERQRLTTTLTKIERSDVQGSEEDMLSPAELQVLAQWRRRESWFLAEINRIDDSVMLLRDL